MNQKQSDHLTRDESLLITLNNYHSIWSGNSIFVSAVASLQTKVTGVGGLQVGQISGSAGITLTKTQTEDNLIDLTLAHADAGRAYVMINNNTTLAENLKLSKTKLKLLTDAQLASACQNVYNLVNPLVASLSGYGVNAASLLALQSGISSFNGMVGAPQSARATAKAYTTNLALQLSSIDTFLDDTLDPLMTQYKISQPVFYEAYVESKKLKSHGHRTKVSVNVTVTNGGAAAENAVVKIVVGSKTRKKVTDVDGVVRYRLTPPVNTTVTVALTGFATQTKTVVAATAQTVDLVFAFGSGGGTTPTGGTTTGTTPPATA